MRTGGGFTYFRRDFPIQADPRKNPLHWKYSQLPPYNFMTGLLMFNIPLKFLYDNIKCYFNNRINLKNTLSSSGSRPPPNPKVEALGPNDTF